MSRIAQGALTNSKRPESFIVGVYPKEIVKGERCFLYDSTNRKFTDFICGLGANLIGYNNREVNDAITKQINNGITHSLPTKLEREYAELVAENFPVMEKIKIFKTGTEACMAAVRIARAATGRTQILSEGYHGWSDEFIGQDADAVGIPWSGKLDVNGLRSLENISPLTAAVIVEPVILRNDGLRISFLRKLQKKCQETGALLIFDECVTGMRYPNKSVSNDTGIKPDLLILGKAIANGMPLAIVGGKPEIMDGQYFTSGTFCGEAASIAASIATIKFCTRDVLGLLRDGAVRFQAQFNNINQDLVRLDGYGTRCAFKYANEEVGAKFMQAACDANILFGPTFFWNYHHGDESYRCLETCKAIIRDIAFDRIRLRGPLPVKPFANRQRQEELYDKD